MEKIFHANGSEENREARIAMLISDKKTLKQKLYNKRQRRTQQLFSSDKPPEVEWFKKIFAPLFTALFTIAKLLKQPRCSSLHEWIKKWMCAHTCKQHTRILHSQKGKDLSICNNMDRPRGYYVKWN